MNFKLFFQSGVSGITVLPIWAPCVDLFVFGVSDFLLYLRSSSDLPIWEELRKQALYKFRYLKNTPNGLCVESNELSTHFLLARLEM